MRHQQQINDHTCVQACLAMVSGRTTQDVICTCDYIGFNGVSEKLQEMGMDQLHLFWNRFVFRKLLPIEGIAYIISVPSLNIVGGGHSIVIEFIDDIMEIHDPNAGREGKLVYEIDADLRTWNSVYVVIPRI